MEVVFFFCACKFYEHIHCAFREFWKILMFNFLSELTSKTQTSSIFCILEPKYHYLRPCFYFSLFVYEILILSTQIFSQLFFLSPASFHHAVAALRMRKIWRITTSALRFSSSANLIIDLRPPFPIFSIYQFFFYAALLLLADLCRIRWIHLHRRILSNVSRFC